MPELHLVGLLYIIALGFVCEVMIYWTTGWIFSRQTVLGNLGFLIFLQYLLNLLIPCKETALSNSTKLNIDSADSSGSQGKLIHFLYLAATPLEAAL